MVKDAAEAFSRTVITYRGKPEAVMMAYDEFEGWLETLEIAQDPGWRSALAKAAKENKAGKSLSYKKVVGKPQKRIKRH